MIKLKKRYFLILILVIFVLSISYVNATKEINSTENITINEENHTILEINETNTTIAEGTDSTPNKNTVAYKQPTKKQRTFKIGKFKAVLSKKQYKKLFLISSTEKLFEQLNNTNLSKFKGYKVWDNGLHYSTIVKTNKYIKLKINVASPVMKPKYKYKKVRVYMYFGYDTTKNILKKGHVASLDFYTGHCRVQIVGKNAKYFDKCKYSKSFTKLKKSKLIKRSKVFKLVNFLCIG